MSFFDEWGNEIAKELHELYDLHGHGWRLLGVRAIVDGIEASRVLDVDGLLSIMGSDEDGMSTVHFAPAFSLKDDAFCANDLGECTCAFRAMTAGGTADSYSFRATDLDVPWGVAVR